VPVPEKLLLLYDASSLKVELENKTLDPGSFPWPGERAGHQKAKIMQKSGTSHLLVLRPLNHWTIQINLISLN
jgi:hypothetical protein